MLRFKKYVNRKRLVLSSEKSKLIFEIRKKEERRGSGSSEDSSKGNKISRIYYAKEWRNGGKMKRIGKTIVMKKNEA